MYFFRTTKVDLCQNKCYWIASITRREKRVWKKFIFVNESVESLKTRKYEDWFVCQLQCKKNFLYYNFDFIFNAFHIAMREKKLLFHLFSFSREIYWINRECCRYLDSKGIWGQIFLLIFVAFVPPLIYWSYLTWTIICTINCQDYSTRWQD